MAQTKLNNEMTGETEELLASGASTSETRALIGKRDKSLDRITTINKTKQKETEASGPVSPGNFLKERKVKREMDKQGEEIRILLLGKTGSGKSASGNTILNEQFFEVEHFLESNVERSFTKTKIIDGTRVQVTDTPGIFNTSMTESDVIYQIKLGLEFSNRGVHVILLVINLTSKYTKEEREAVEFIQKNLGEKAQKHIMVLFTHGDVLEEPEEIETYLYKSQSLKMLTDKYKSRYQVFNNRSRDENQVRELLQKIDQIMRKNGDGLYTREMFEEAQRNIDESKSEDAEKEQEEAEKELEQLRKQLRMEQKKAIQEREKLQEQLQTERDNAVGKSIIMGLTGAVGAIGAIVALAVIASIKQ